jgi:hypothetical protein
MTLGGLLSDLRSRDIKLWVEGDKLCYSAASGALTPALAAELAEHKTEILRFLGATQIADSHILRIARGGNPPLSFAQQRLWFLDQIHPQGARYNISHAVRLSGTVDVTALQKSLDMIVKRHEILRTNIDVADGSPVQVISESQPVPLLVTDLSEWSADKREAEMYRSIHYETRRPFNLSSDLMLRAGS